MLNEKVVMITGVSKGLGREIALAFAKEGAKLAICARSEQPLLKLETEIERLGVEVLAVIADVSKPRDVERFVSQTEKRFGKIDVLINNASILGPSPMPLLADYPEQDFGNVLNTNVLSTFYMTKRVLPGMLVQDSGSILNVTSSAGHIGYAGWGAYSVSKFAIEGLTYVWADELAETGVRINLVDPGEMDTEMHKLAVPDCDYELNDPKAVAKVFVTLVSQDDIKHNGKLIEVDALLEEGEKDVNKYSEL
jgi:NAD(P)-dependent dehydrogenase (short-subunit alcohol dehydrogenase family)